MNLENMRTHCRVASSIVALLAAAWIFPAAAGAQPWPDVFDPGTLLNLNLEMDPGDWLIVQNDETFSIELPAWFWADGEETLLVAVRRKSCVPLTGDSTFMKVSLKIDINQYVVGQSWHDLKKLSLENGDDHDVVSEGLAWYHHRGASGPEGYGYAHSAGYFSWVTLYINGTYTGVYVSPEQRDKRFLENRGLWVEGDTWLYKISDEVSGGELVEGILYSPTYASLCYAPFQPSPSCSTPVADSLAVILPQLINMQGMLTMAAVNTFNENPDALFNSGKNTFFADFLAGGPRTYFPWDQDSAIQNGYGLFYPWGSPYADIILDVTEFYDQYTQTLIDLISGPLSEANLHAFLDTTETLLTAALEADLNNQFEGSVAEHFDGLRDWVSLRISRAYSQLPFGAVETTDPLAASAFSLCSPTPNPSSSASLIRWAMPDAGHVRLQVYDVMGRLVATLVNETRAAGEHGVVWHGLDQNRQRVSAGVYFARIESGPWSSVRKIVRVQP